jgi:glutamine synthetase
MRECGGQPVRGQHPLLALHLIVAGAQECANAVVGLFADSVRSYRRVDIFVCPQRG